MPTTDLDELLDFMRSTDLSRYEKEKGKFFTGDSRFLNAKAQEQMAVLSASFPRSGSSMIRKYMENITGTPTGNEGLTRSLFFNGFKGEGIYDGRVFLKKNHFPHFPFNSAHTEMDYIVVGVRYPLDVLPSYFHMNTSGGHVETFQNSFQEELIHQKAEVDTATPERFGV